MLKKKKQNVYFRLGLKPQQGYLVATYAMPRDEYKDMTISDWLGTARLQIVTDVFQLITTMSNVNKTIKIDETLTWGTVYGPFQTTDNDGNIASGPLRRLFHDERVDDGYGLSQIVYVNENKEIVYRYPDGYVDRFSAKTETGTSPEPIWGPTAVRVEFIESSNVSETMAVKEQKYSPVGDPLNIELIVDERTKSRAITGNNYEIRVYNEDGSYDIARYGELSATSASGEKMMFGISPMGTVFIEYTSLSINPNNGWQVLYTTERFTIADKNGETTLPPYFGGPVRVTPTYENSSVAIEFARNYWSWHPTPTIIKANDKDSFLMETDEGESIFVKNNIEYHLNPTNFEINGVQYDLLGGDFVDFFCASSMMQVKTFDQSSLEFDGLFHWGGLYDRQYMITSWFGDFLYRVRIDEFIEEPYWTQELDWIINAWDSEYRTNDRNTKKGPAEALGVVGGAFFFDILQKNKTLADMRIISAYMKDYAPVGQMLKIYQPGTNKLWVEKFRLDIKDGEANLVYVERFQVPFFSPVETQTKAALDFDVQTTEEYFTRMKSICYVPYDYVPPTN